MPGLVLGCLSSLKMRVVWWFRVHFTRFEKGAVVLFVRDLPLLNLGIRGFVLGRSCSSKMCVLLWFCDHFVFLERAAVLLLKI